MLGTPTPRVMGNASTAAAAQLCRRTPGRAPARRPATRPRPAADGPASPARRLTEDEMLRIATESGRAVTEQLNAVRNALTKMAQRPRRDHPAATATPPTRSRRYDGGHRPFGPADPGGAGEQPAATDQPKAPEPPPKSSRSCWPSSTRWSGWRPSRARSTARSRCCRIEAKRERRRAQGADHHPPPGLRRQPRHRQDHRRPAGGGHLPGARPAQQGPARSRSTAPSWWRAISARRR